MCRKNQCDQKKNIYELVLPLLKKPLWQYGLDKFLSILWCIKYIIFLNAYFCGNSTSQCVIGRDTLFRAMHFQWERQFQENTFETGLDGEAMSRSKYPSWPHSAKKSKMNDYLFRSRDIQISLCLFFLYADWLVHRTHELLCFYLIAHGILNLES